MDSHNFIDNIKIEKANALSRYKRFNNISKMLRLIEVFVAVALISWCSTRFSTFFKVLNEYLYAFSCYILNQHVVFLVGNVIVILCYVLSCNQSDHDPGHQDHDQSEDTNKTFEVNSNGELVLPSVELVIPPVVDINTVVINDTEDKVVVAETAIKQAAKRIERFQRTQSAKLKREMSMKPCRELRRVVTERRRRVVSGGGGGGDTAVERLSNEEFRLAVEAFILKQQSFLKQQTMVN